MIGRSFDLELLAAVLAEDPARLTAPLTELANHHLLLPTATPGRMGFRHSLICDAIYDHIAEPERRRLHLRTAEAAAGRADVGTDAFLSLHFERGGRPAEAFESALAGARATTAISSHGEAAELYRRAIRTAPADLAQSAYGDLMEAYGRSCAATDLNAEAAVAEGMTNARIVQELHVAPKTVSAHVEHILAKLGVGRRAEIAAWVAKGLVLHSRPHGRDREE